MIGCRLQELLAAQAAAEQHVQQLQSAEQSHLRALHIAVEQHSCQTSQLELQHESAVKKVHADCDKQLRQLQVAHEDGVAGIRAEHDRAMQRLFEKFTAVDSQGVQERSSDLTGQSQQVTAPSDAEECSEGWLPTVPGLVHQSSGQAATNDGMLSPLTCEEAASAAPKHRSGLSICKVRGGAPQATPTTASHQQQQVGAPPCSGFAWSQYCTYRKQSQM